MKNIYKKLLDLTEKKYSIFIFAILPAIIIGIIFTFEKLFILAWIAPSFFIFYFFVKLDKNFKKSILFKYAYIFCFFYYLSIYYWFYSLYPMDMMDFSKGTAIFVVIFAWIAISAVHALELSLAFLVYSFIRPKKAWQKALLLPSLWLIFEYVEELGILGFPWARIGMSQYFFLPIIQSASLFGPYFISFILVLFATLLSLFVMGNKRAITVAVSIFVANLIFGIIYMNVPFDIQNTASTAIVQGNIASGEKWSGKVSAHEKYLSLSLDIKEDTDIIVWPETATSRSISEYSSSLADYTHLSRLKTAELYTGAFYYDDSGRYNSLFFIDEKGITQRPYAKRHLVPFGEFLPFRTFFKTFIPPLTKLNMISSDLTPGTDSAVFESEYGKIGGLVCFDSIFQSLARQSVKDGAQLLMVVTNDSWYKDSSAIFQHNAQSVFRAIENRRFVVRAANTGVSSFIDQNGRILEYLDPLVEGVIYTNVSFINSKTLYTYLGDIVVLLAFMYSLSMAVICYVNRKN